MAGMIDLEVHSFGVLPRGAVSGVDHMPISGEA